LEIIPAIPAPELKAATTLEGINEASPNTVPYSIPAVNPIARRVIIAKMNRVSKSYTSAKMKGRAISIAI
jgi:hypothetical protein